jgi:hypothetical protein
MIEFFKFMPKAYPDVGHVKWSQMVSDDRKMTFHSERISPTPQHAGKNAIVPCSVAIFEIDQENSPLPLAN